MATFRIRPSGTVEVILRRKDMLPGPVYLTFQNEAEARSYAAKVEAMMDAGIVPDAIRELARPKKEEVNSGIKSPCLSSVFKRYRASCDVSSADLDVLASLDEEVGETLLADVTTHWAADQVKLYKGQERSPSTIRHKIGALARCLDWLVVSRREIEFNPVRLLPKRYASYNEVERKAMGRESNDTERDRRLEAGDEARIRKVLTGDKGDCERGIENAEDMALLFDLALETAMRMREIYTLTGDQISIEQRTIWLDRTKNGDRRQVPLSSVAAGIVKQRVEDSKGGRLFPKIWDGDLSRLTLRKITSKLSGRWRTVARLAKCSDLRFHDLRHEATCRLFERTKMTDTEIAKITGHKDPRMLLRYANLRASTLAEKMW